MTVLVLFSTSNHYLRGQNRIWPPKLLNYGFDSTEAHSGAPTVGAKILRCFNPGYRRAAAKKRTTHRGGVRFWARASSVADTRRPAAPR